MTRALVLALLAVGCAEALPPDVACERPATLRVDVASGALLNPDETGVALPTEIRVIELRDATALADVSFDEAWAPVAPLDAAIVGSQSATLYPDESTSLVVTPSGETHAIAVMAVVRRPAGRTWRVIVPADALPCGAEAALSMRVDEYRVERAPVGAEESR